ncbi:MAG: hypothetical protein ACI4QO_08625 [Clostridia bacterium]
MAETEEQTIFLKDGKECEILFETENPETGKKYMAYTDHSLDFRGHARMYLVSLVENGNGFIWLPIGAEEAQAVIGDVLDCLLPEMEETE